MKQRAAKTRMADLFATLPDAAPAKPAPVVPALVAPAEVPAAPASKPRAKQLWYAVVFPELPPQEAAAMLQRLCLHAQNFTSFVSIEPPNALLLEIRGSVKLFGSLQKLHADIDGCWRRLDLAAVS